jgi:hypothetical protein
LQGFYYKVKTNDIIVSEATSEVGTIRKDSKRIHVIKANNEFDLYNWVNRDIKIKVKVYRPVEGIKSINKLDFAGIKSMIKADKFELIVEN